MTITQTQAQALATFVNRLRPDWDQPGILAAISKARHMSSTQHIAFALIKLSENEALRTPALLAEPGRHWDTGAGEHTGNRVSHDVHCVDHPTQVHPCPTCRAEKPPLSPEAIAELRAVALEAKTRAPRPKFGTSKREAVDREHACEDARRRADAEVDL